MTCPNCGRRHNLRKAKRCLRRLSDIRKLRAMQMFIAEIARKPKEAS